MNRRSFLAALGGTILAPFIPAIDASPKLDTLPFGEILSGKYPLFLSAGNESGPVRSIGRQKVAFAPPSMGVIVSEQVNFGEIKESCVVDRVFLENEDGSIQIKIPLEYMPFHLCLDDTLHVDANVSLSFS